MQRCEDCFAGNKKGKCNALTENFIKKRGHCPFYKPKEEFNKVLEEIDKRDHERFLKRVGE